METKFNIKRYIKWGHYNSSGQKCSEEQLPLIVNQLGAADGVLYCPQCQRSLFIWKSKIK